MISTCSPRFFVDINYNNKIITAHCPNSGSMMGLLDEGNRVWFSKENNPGETNDFFPVKHYNHPQSNTP